MDNLPGIYSWSDLLKIIAPLLPLPIGLVLVAVLRYIATGIL